MGREGGDKGKMGRKQRSAEERRQVCRDGRKVKDKRIEVVIKVREKEVAVLFRHLCCVFFGPHRQTGGNGTLKHFTCMN